MLHIGNVLPGNSAHNPACAAGELSDHDLNVPSSKQTRKLFLHVIEFKKAHSGVRLKFYQHIDIAFRTKIIP